MKKRSDLTDQERQEICSANNCNTKCPIRYNYSLCLGDDGDEYLPQDWLNEKIEIEEGNK